MERLITALETLLKRREIQRSLPPVGAPLAREQAAEQVAMAMDEFREALTEFVDGRVEEVDDILRRRDRQRAEAD